ncbi:TetR/AcrR family transcriptional regulator [Blastococcus sp. PRF04-17]|uniref:TetR/AcrR family transcriptional regulator n=1 Tax=Blastococcus sp. PRF04-17 TaxID=2933797 RepID=UPI001FF53FD8|nr:TetR/AcrR family transcriptional regulator [Blastococcus sp. PRF04-17]UOY00254.1 TetR/AcrR family transcriptional regulator [Blastococcus sp. PRF04-17]
MSETGDRRARKKAETRARICRVAHALFAAQGFESVTIADIAREADVAVQTVFNHFATKEELFFEGRADWVGGAAAAVRNRPAGVPTLSALREHLIQSVRDYLAAVGSPEHCGVVATLEASPALSAYERELHHESVRLLSEALREASEEDPTLAPITRTGLAPDVVASLTAGVWMAAVRALLVQHRSRLVGTGAEDATRAAVERFAEQVLTQFEGMTPDSMAPDSMAAGTTVTGWPTGVRRVG